MSARPSRRQRPWTVSTLKPGETSRTEPPSCIVFQGVPRPPSQALGHWPTQPPAGGSSVAAEPAEARAQPDA